MNDYDYRLKVHRIYFIRNIILLIATGVFLYLSQSLFSLLTLVFWGNVEFEVKDE